MVISFLTTSFPRYDGDFAGSFIHKYVLELGKLGAKIEVVAPDDQDACPLTLPPEINLTRFKYFIPRSSQSIAYGTGIPNRFQQNRWSIFQVPFLISAFFVATLRSTRKSDLLHAFWSPAAIISIVVSLIKSRPVVVTLWGSDISVLKIPILSHIFRVILSKANIIICENEHFKTQLVQLNFPDEKIIVLPNGIDFEQFKPRDKLSARTNLKLPEDRIIILSVGSLTKNKGHKYLIHAFSELAHKNDRIHLYIVGGGDEHEALKYEIDRLKLNGKVDLIGETPNETIAIWLNAADIFVLPSLQEGTPNSLLEAMATGLPPIASAAGGIPEIIEDEKNGFLVTPANSNEIKEKLSHLLESSELRDQLGKKARLKLMSDYNSWEEQAKNLQNIYQQLLKN
jgi:glycosyltransferase involved in cell wall biosynthesis